MMVSTISRTMMSSKVSFCNAHTLTNSSNSCKCNGQQLGRLRVYDGTHNHQLHGPSQLPRGNRACKAKEYSSSVKGFIQSENSQGNANESGTSSA
eukprot:5473229-Amphidinium_carterae.1